ncbi:hypothetical protein [Rhodanobacter glycinis]|uniref:PKD domain-containing protein n=1 Tax=Rhodanobacter glycinis TaxID=582702 RepID=A0A1I3Z3H6_9GAMM|nr:hypothetical protein [Rhodanobacter glycinis]SFK38615.1 hypothetical protein SAMN05192579_102174 [Rhodanobacter glycinis]
MKINHRITTLGVLSLAVALSLSACGKQGEPTTAPAGTPPPTAQPDGAAAPSAQAPTSVSVTDVELGNAVGADQKVATPSSSFAPSDTIYAAVTTSGAGTAALAAKWTYQDGQTVHEESKSIAPTGPATTAFQISKPSGWPAGSYKVAISLNGQPVSSKDFTVQ